jgi:hypothetical protein
MIRIPNMAGWRIIIQPQFLDELIRAPDDVLSFHEATSDVSKIFLGLLYAEHTYGMNSNALTTGSCSCAYHLYLQLIQTRYTFGDHITDNEYHHTVVRNQVSLLCSTIQ